MSSTGTAAFTVTRDEMTSAALRVLRVLRAGDTASANALTTGGQAVNMLLKDWMSQGLMLWCYQLITIPCVANQQSYTIGPTGADVAYPRPLRLFDGTFIRKTITGVVTDVPLRLLSRQGYEQTKTKGVSSTTDAVYYEPGIYIAPTAPTFKTSPSTGYGTLYLFYPSVDTSFTIYGNFQRQVYDMTTGTDQFDVPAEWFQAIKYGLAAALADEYEVPESRCTRLIKMAQMYQQELEDWQELQNNVNFAEKRQQQERAQLQDKPRL